MSSTIVRCGRSALQRALLGGIALLGASTLGAQERSVCDSLYLRLAKGPHGYRSVDGRCEGIHEQPVAGTPVYLMSLAARPAELTIDRGDSLLLEWPRLTAPRPIRIRAQSATREWSFAMDVDHSSEAHTYVWPSDILWAASIAPSDVGFVATMNADLGAGVVRTLLPVTIRKNGQPSIAPNYELSLFTIAQLDEVYVSVHRLDQRARVSHVFRTAKPLRYGYYPAQQPIPLPVPELSTPGRYVIQISASITDGPVVTLAPIYVTTCVDDKGVCA